VPPVLVNINQQRERFRDNLPIRLVFLVRYFTIKYLIHRKILLTVKPNKSFRAAAIASIANGIKAKELPKFARFKN
jgi:hypothetical protein